ncbi:porin family protein [Rhizobiaceae bacterium n13]|uniref:Porin family protein n=1 Tax=Ferirhizobium litorale TaxID=2927786 RepID=A0AAE3U268_9HYPH|nr:porin family protein [Fererhizobium litorale]MDI7862319.1 porin family protein [Fererhizobium litorale]MDI7922407.1 porin family protein [Fererhizobium litorale]
MIKSFIATAATFAALAGTALAADLTPPPEAAPIAEEIPAFTWSGGYVGLQGGGTWADGDISAGGSDTTRNLDGGLFGAFAGWNFQNNNFVYGVEGDAYYNWNDNGNDLFGSSAEVGTEWAGGIRGRLGYTFDRAMIYGTAGWTATRGFVDVPGNDDKETLNGWTVGAGLDYAITNNVFGRAEYRYNDYGSADFGGVKMDVQQNQVTIGVGVKF